MSTASHAAEVGIVFEIHGEVGGYMVGEAVVDFDLNDDVGLKGTALPPRFGLEAVEARLVGGFHTCVGGLGTAVAIGCGPVGAVADALPVHIIGLVVIIEELETGIKVEVGQDVLFEVLSFDVATEGEVDVVDLVVGGRVGRVE